MGINLGDVGYISDGRFEMLLSARSALTSPKLKVPPEFRDVIKRRIEANRQGPGCLHTKGVKRIGRSNEKQDFTPLYVLFIIPPPTIYRNDPPRLNDVGDMFTFELSGSGGAALVTRYPTAEVDSPKELQRLFEDYLLDNFGVWPRFAKENSQKIKPVIVSGFDLTGNLAMMSYSSKGLLKSRAPVTSPMFSTDPDFQGKWSFKSPPHCEEHPSTSPDQCVFVRYITIRKRSRVLRLLGGAGSDSEGSDSGGSEVETDNVRFSSRFRISALRLFLRMKNTTSGISLQTTYSRYLLSSYR